MKVITATLHRLASTSCASGPQPKDAGDCHISRFRRNASPLGGLQTMTKVSSECASASVSLGGATQICGEFNMQHPANIVITRSSTKDDYRRLSPKVSWIGHHHG